MESVNLFSLPYEELMVYLEQHRDVNFTRHDWIKKLELEDGTPSELMQESIKLNRPVYVEFLFELYPKDINIGNVFWVLMHRIRHHQVALLDVLLNQFKLDENAVRRLLAQACEDNFYDVVRLIYKYYPDTDPAPRDVFRPPLWLALLTNKNIKPDDSDPGDLVRFLLIKFTGDWVDLTEFTIVHGTSSALGAVLENPNATLGGNTTHIRGIIRRCEGIIKRIGRILIENSTDDESQLNFYRNSLNECVAKINIILQSNLVIDLSEEEISKLVELSNYTDDV